MSFTCNYGGRPHQHELAYEARVCWGLIQPPQPPVAVRPYEPHHIACTRKQMDYIERLGGDLGHAARLTKSEASAYIDKLKNGEAARVTTTPAERPVDPRITMLKGLLPSMPDGYYATEAEEGAHTTFMRISRPKPGTRKWAGAIKIQTQHGPTLEVAAALWPSGQLSVFRGSILDPLMLLVADYQGSALRYARRIGKCARCNSPLTDERSRHYGIGPECEKYWPWMIEQVDALSAG